MHTKHTHVVYTHPHLLPTPPHICTLLPLQDVAYVSLANVLYRTGYEQDAAVVMQLSLEVCVCVCVCVCVVSVCVVCVWCVSVCCVCVWACCMYVCVCGVCCEVPILSSPPRPLPHWWSITSPWPMCWQLR